MECKGNLWHVIFSDELKLVKERTEKCSLKIKKKTTLKMILKGCLGMDGSHLPCLSAIFLGCLSLNGFRILLEVEGNICIALKKHLQS